MLYTQSGRQIPPVSFSPSDKICSFFVIGKVDELFCNLVGLFPQTFDEVVGLKIFQCKCFVANFLLSRKKYLMSDSQN